MRGWNEVVVPLDVSLMSLRRVESDAAREASAVLSTHANFDRRAGAFATFLALTLRGAGSGEVNARFSRVTLQTEMRSAR